MDYSHSFANHRRVENNILQRSSAELFTLNDLATHIPDLKIYALEAFATSTLAAFVAIVATVDNNVVDFVPVSLQINVPPILCFEPVATFLVTVDAET